MAINKARTSPLMKTMIVALAGTFVLSIGFAGLSTIPGCSAGPLLPQPNAGVDNTASTDTTAALAARYGQQIASIEATLQANPKNYDLLVAQGDAYLSWAIDYVALTKTLPDTTTTVSSAVSLFKRALAIKATDGPVIGNYALALYYSGDTTAAIAAAVQARTVDPAGIQNIFNLGNYYAQAGDTVKALEAYKAVLAANPTAEQAAAAQQAISQLGSK